MAGSACLAVSSATPFAERFDPRGRAFSRSATPSHAPSHGLLAAASDGATHARGPPALLDCVRDAVVYNASRLIIASGRTKHGYAQKRHGRRLVQLEPAGGL